MRKGTIVFPLFVSLLVLFGCSKFKVGSFVMPSWNMELDAPIFNRTYTLQEILWKDSTMVSNGDTTFIQSVGASQTFQLFRSQSINAVSVGNNLKISAVPTTYVSQSPSDFSIANPPPIHYASVIPGIHTGSVPSVPAIPAQSNNLTPVDAFTNFNNATFSSGNFTLALHNGYPAAINFVNGLNLIDYFGKQVNIPVPGNSIAANTTVTLQPFSLAGITLSNQPAISFTYSSNGPSNPATIQSDTVVTYSASLSNVRVSSANAIVPRQPDILINNSVVLVDSNKVSTASIANGTLSFFVTNNFAMNDSVYLQIAGLITSTGKAFADSFLLPAGGSIPKQYSLANYTLNMADPVTGQPTDSLRYSVKATIPGSGGSLINISTSDSVNAQFSLTALQLNSFTGEVHLKDLVSIPPDTQKVSLSDFSSKFNGTITFSPSTQLVLNVNSSGGFPTHAHIVLIPANTLYPSIYADSAVVDTVIYPGVNHVIIGQKFVNVLNEFTATPPHVMPDEFIISGYVRDKPWSTLCSFRGRNSEEHRPSDWHR